MLDAIESFETYKLRRVIAGAQNPAEVQVCSFNSQEKAESVTRQ